MSYFLFTVEKIWKFGKGITIGEGVRMNDLSSHPNVKNFIQGIVLELRYPNGTKQKTFLLNYGVSAYRQNEENLLIEENPFVRFTLPDDSIGEENLIGTEIWWLNEEIGKSSDEITELLKAN